MITAKQVVSDWEFIKKILERENVWLDPQIQTLDKYFNQQLTLEISKEKNG